jgi:anti-sigma regulatory factor (Ser/Thr protein kinase)
VHAGEVYAGDPLAISAARQLTAKFLGTLDRAPTAVSPAVIADVQLVVSELVTNAVKYTDGPCGVDLRVDGDEVEITVWDTSSQQAVVMEADPARVGRHGLEIVTALCGGFTTTPTSTGKAITVRMGLRPPAS